jgi:hypothetical protein
LFKFDHVFGGREFHFGLGAYRYFRPDSTLEVGIEALFQIQFGTVPDLTESTQATTSSGAGSL